jgi:3-isopropylmalate/(R)-2-methylmalate dehydratase large subunit
MKPRTLLDKIWDAHVVATRADGTCLLYVDRHLIHEVTSPQAFEGLRRRGLPVRRPDLTLAMPDHNIPTTPRRTAAGAPVPIGDADAARLIEALRRNSAEAGIRHIDADAREQGIVHVVGPEQGFTLPGSTLVCGDSHTSAHGAIGALAFGIGTSDVEHVLATQTLLMRKPRAMEVVVEGSLGFGVTAKDLILAIIRTIGAAGANGHIIEYRGETIRKLSVEGRLTLCNMSAEAGARAGLIAPDGATFDYLEGRPLVPAGAQWEQAVESWRTLASDAGAQFDQSILFDASKVAPMVSWGISPEDGEPIDGVVPDPASFGAADRQAAARRALDYMGLAPGTRLDSIEVGHVFIGSCTNSRIEDLRAAAAVLVGRHIAPNIRQALVVPGSGLVKRQAEAEGLDRIFTDAGFEWREPGCSMCLAMNPDRVPPGERCASTSNRNFIGRQGPGARTHLLSPAMAAAAAVTGRLTDVRAFVDSGISRSSLSR